MSSEIVTVEHVHELIKELMKICIQIDEHVHRVEEKVHELAGRIGHEFAE